jgi:sterol desaturase/sphingolipid hydroxylase (fatty acid hydroxylase superfamily)
MFCHDADDIQAPIKKFQRQELDSLLNNAVITITNDGLSGNRLLGYPHVEAEPGADVPGNLIYLFGLGAIAIAMLWEAMMPRRVLQQGIVWRWSNNFALSLLSYVITTLASVAFVLWLSRWTQINQFGLFQSVHAPAAVVFLVLLLASQFLSYLVHIAFHRYSWLWPIHAVHHTDVDVDVSTSYRHHPLEALISLPVVGPRVLLLGIGADIAIAFTLFQIGATLFSHSNIRIPETLPKYLHFLILTPDFHRLHDCAEVRYTNSNYGSLVPWFDYLFGTVSSRPYSEQEDMRLGLDYLRKPDDGRIDRLLWEPVLVRRALREKRAQKSDRSR